MLAKRISGVLLTLMIVTGFPAAASGLIEPVLYGRNDAPVLTTVTDPGPVSVEEAQVAASMASALSLQSAFHQIAETVIPVVVQIDTTTTRTSRRSQFPFPFEQPGGTGSGIIVHSDGDTYYVLTNNHVVENTSSLTVRLEDNTDLSAKLVGRDTRRDLALLAVTSRQTLPVAVLGDSDQATVGDWALAIGSPYGFQSSMTAGIISAVGRDTTSRLAGNIGEYIQTDAAINPGNSGGALVNLSGQVIGINTWIASRTGGSSGVGFALPINAARRSIEDMIANGEAQYGYLGVFIGTPSQKVATDLGADRGGALTWSVIPESPAAAAGLQPGDLVTSVNGDDVAGQSDLIRHIAGLAPGSEAHLQVMRGGQRHEVTVHIGNRANAAQDVADWPGLYPVPIDQQIRDRLRLGRSVAGVVVASVNDGSAAGQAGVRSSDVITAIDGRDVASVAGFYAALSGKTNVELDVLRNGSRHTIRLRG